MLSLIKKKKGGGEEGSQPIETDVISKWKGDGWEKFSSFKDASPQILEMEFYFLHGILYGNTE